MDLEKIHAACGWHEEAVVSSSRCGCFHCLAFFPATGIGEWVDEPETGPRGPGRTALCPKCGIDAVLPESEDYDLTLELLKAMQARYF